MRNLGRYAKFILPAMAIMVAILFLIAPTMQTEGAAQRVSPSATQAQANYEPDPALNVQAVWSSFNSSMTYNEYLNSTGKPAYLNVEKGTGDFISINPGDIKENLTYPSYANQSKVGVLNFADYNQVTSNANNTYSTAIAGNDIYLNITTNSNDAIYDALGWTIPFSDMPSSNLQYDYITMEYKLSGSDITGEQSFIELGDNNGGYHTYTTLNGTGSGYYTFNLASSGYNETDFVNHYVSPAIGVSIPKTTSAESVSLEITGMTIGTYPLSLGTNSTGRVVNGGAGTIRLANFKPAIPMNITNKGYSENLTQPLSLVQANETQAAVASGNYVEQVTYQAKFSLPSAPDLSYSAANFSLGLGAPGSQYVALDVNGVSYLSSIASDQANETVVLLSSVNPTSTISFLAVVDYTASQWNNIAAAPGFFSDPVGFIEYYWWLAISGLGALFGLAGAKYAAGRNAEHDEVIKR